MNFHALAQLAPELPSYSAKYLPVYFEPIADSGERLTIAIGIQSSDSSTVLHTIDSKIINCMYGEKSQGIQKLIATVTQHLDIYLKQGKSPSDWQPPFSGFSAGEVRTAHSANGIDGVAYQSAAAYSSLYRGDLILNAKQELYPIEETPEQESKRVVSEVKGIMLTMNQHLSKNFNKPVKTTNGTRLTLDYLGVNYNAGLSNFATQTVAKSLGLAKQKIYDLEVLREDRAATKQPEQSYELLVYLPENSNQKAQDTFNELELSADKKEILIRNLPTYQAIANKIAEKEKAA